MIYMDNGATSFPKPKGMAETMAYAIKTYCGNPGRSGHYMSMRTGEEVYKARKNVAEIFNIKNPERLIFTVNTTAALNAGIKGVLCSGDHIVTTAMEHNSVLRPVKALEMSGISHTIVRCGEDGIVSAEDVVGAIKENTKLVVCMHASNVTGSIQPIEEIGKRIAELNKGRNCENRIIFMVDGAQSAGSIPIDTDRMHIDMLAVPGHKGLLGPLGTGALYVKEGIDIYPVTEGGTGTASKELIQPIDFPEGFEAGTVNAPGIIGLGHSAQYIKKTGVTRIRRYEEELTRMLHEELCNMKGIKVYGPSDCTKKTAVVTFNVVDGNGRIRIGCEETTDILANEYGIASRGGFHCAPLAHHTIGTYEHGAVRLSLGPFNDQKEIKTAVNAVFRISRL